MNEINEAIRMLGKAQEIISDPIYKAAPEMYKVLKSIQDALDEDSSFACPYCGKTSQTGHFKDCMLMNALAMAEGKVKEESK